MAANKRRFKYKELVRQTVESSLVPKGMRLLPQVELEGSCELTVRRHSGILEYSHQQVVVLAGQIMYEVEGEGLIITSMSRDYLQIKGKLLGVRIIGGDLR